MNSSFSCGLSVTVRVCGNTRVSMSRDFCNALEKSYLARLLAAMIW